jgi:hypothetical protein
MRRNDEIRDLKSQKVADENIAEENQSRYNLFLMTE